MYKKILVLCLFISGVAYSQTTITLQDQCNCEVLRGDDVNSPGETTPAGASVGNIYVNTISGVIYYWDGDTWEFTSTDSQELSNFNYDVNTNILSLEIESGNTVSVDLSTLNSLNTDNQNAAEVPYDNASSGISATNVQEALDMVNQQATMFPAIYATGKIGGDGSPVVVFGATVSRINEGDYQVTFIQPVVSDYVIQVSVLDCGGDCPGNTGDTFDNPGSASIGI